LRAHARDHARGERVEEREALLVQAFAASGEAHAARERAARFRGRFPKSLFLPVVEQAARSVSDTDPLGSTQIQGRGR
jgi:hypothetical protein